MAEIRKRKTRMYEPWGYQDENNYQGAETILDNELESFFAGTSYNKDDNKIYFTNKDGETKAELDVSEFVKSDSIIEKTEYADGILKIYFTNGDIITIDLSELLDENEFKDGLIVDNHEVKVLIDSTGEPYLSVSENGVKISGVDAAIQVETDRATAAEEALDAKIDAETARATSAETALDEKIDAEIARATSAETALDEKIDAETARAESAETALQTAIEAEGQRAQDAEQALDEKIDQEIADRIADVDAEETRAKAREDEIETALNAEKTRATQTEQGLDHRIDLVNDELDSEESRAQAAEQELRTLLTNEIADRKADVDEEEARAKAAEEVLQNAIEAEEARATSAETSLQAAIEAEGQRAQDAEHALDEKIDAEEARATSAETELQDAIEAESQRAQDAEQTLDEKIDAEEARALSAETALLDALDELGVNKFDDVEYDSSAKTINFYAEGDLVKNLDATPFIKDGMIDRVYIDHDTQELVIVWNTESGTEETRISLSEIFNPDEYYTKDEVDAIETSLDEKIAALRTSLNNEVTRATTKEEELENNDIASGSIASDATVSITKNNGDVITFTSAEQINLEAGEF
jgi:hypothetical protein